MNWRHTLIVGGSIMGIALIGSVGCVGAQGVESHVLDFEKTKPHVEMFTNISYFQSYGWPKSDLKMDILRPHIGISRKSRMFW